MKTALNNFLKHTLAQGKFTGCAYHYLDDHYAVVLAWDDEYGLMGKIAFNCDDLQCDYDIDWLMPYDKKRGEVYDTEYPIYPDSNIALYVHYLLKDAKDFKII